MLRCIELNGKVSAKAILLPVKGSGVGEGPSSCGANFPPEQGEGAQGAAGVRRPDTGVKGQI